MQTSLKKKKTTNIYIFFPRHSLLPLRTDFHCDCTLGRFCKFPDFTFRKGKKKKDAIKKKKNIPPPPSPQKKDFIVSINSYPNITAFHCIILFSDGAPLTPTGGSSCNLEITNIEQQALHKWNASTCKSDSIVTSTFKSLLILNYWTKRCMQISSIPKDTKVCSCITSTRYDSMMILWQPSGLRQVCKAP